MLKNDPVRAVVYDDNTGECLTYDAIWKARAILEREKFYPIGGLCISPVVANFNELQIPDWLTHDYWVTGEVVNVCTT